MARCRHKRLSVIQVRVIFNIRLCFLTSSRLFRASLRLYISRLSGACFAAPKPRQLQAKLHCCQNVMRIAWNPALDRFSCLSTVQDRQLRVLLYRTAVPLSGCCELLPTNPSRQTAASPAVPLSGHCALLPISPSRQAAARTAVPLSGCCTLRPVFCSESVRWASTAAAGRTGHTTNA